MWPGAPTRSQPAGPWIPTIASATSPAADRHACPVDDHGEQPDQGLRRGAADAQASYTGFVNGDTSASLTTQPTLSTTATAASHVAGSPYTHHRQRGCRFRLQHQLRGRHADRHRCLTNDHGEQPDEGYGAALPTLTASYTGFVNGDTSASLTTQPTLSTTATAASHVAGSPYSITASGAVDSDYSISYVAGQPDGHRGPTNDHCEQPEQALRRGAADSDRQLRRLCQRRYFGEPDHAANAEHKATAASHVAGSPYAITASGAVDSDYSISYVAGSLTVTPAPLTITATTRPRCTAQRCRL